MANRIITATVTGETIKLSNKTAGAAGSFNAVSLSLTFDSAWDGTTKKLYFFDAYGNNAVYRLLTTELLVDGAYIVPIPAEPLAYAGEMTITIRGIDFATDGTTAERIIMSASTTMKVLPAIAPASDVAPVEPTPTQAEQLQSEIDGIKSDLAGIPASVTAAANSATAAATSESNAASSAAAASTSADNASASASAASTSASNASSSANASASSASAAASSASAADDAKTAAASSASAAATSEANAASSAQAAANSAASLVVVNDLTTGGTTNALSAEQGKILSTSISTLTTEMTEKTSYGVYSGLAVSPQSTPNMTVSVTTGTIYMANGVRFTPAANTALAITAADATNPRIDIVYVNSSGAIAYLAGTAAASPTSPAVPTGGQKLAEISVAANSTKVTYATIADRRKTLTGEAWITPTFLNGWTTHPGYPVKYFKDATGNVHIVGMLKTGATFVTAFLLPVGYRPNQRLIISVDRSGSYARIFIQPTGDVQPDNAEVDLGEAIFSTN